jgi:hypothetical protein
MDDRTIPPSTFPPPLRVCEISRLQGQLLAQAYLRICPEIRRMLDGGQPATSNVPTRPHDSIAARAAAGA